MATALAPIVSVIKLVVEGRAVNTTTLFTFNELKLAVSVLLFRTAGVI